MGKITEDQKAFMVKLYASGETTVKIGQYLQVSPSTVNYWLRRCGVTLRGPRETSTRCELRHDAFDELTPRATAGHIAKKIVVFLYRNATVALDRKAATAAKIATMRDVHLSAECARLDQERARLIQIADWYQDGASLKQIGMRLGVSDVTILHWMEQAGYSSSRTTRRTPPYGVKLIHGGSPGTTAVGCLSARL
ncbi:MAG: helix-turn-helix domain-containing protein [Solirubrobacteraceae bacterium]